MSDLTDRIEALMSNDWAELRLILKTMAGEKTETPDADSPDRGAARSG